jgi:hypothetical protein
METGVTGYSRFEVMHSTDALPDQAAYLLKVYLSGGALPGNVNPLVLIEMAKRSGDYARLLGEAKSIRTLRERIRSHALESGAVENTEEEQIRAYMQTADSPEELSQLAWLMESLHLSRA